jgi:hypothetical protein
MGARFASTADRGWKGYLSHLGRVLWGHESLAPDEEHGAQYWSVMHVDENGLLQKSTVRVLDVQLDLRSLTVWCQADGHQRTLRLSKVVEAVDISSGRRIHLQHWLLQHVDRHPRPRRAE